MEKKISRLEFSNGLTAIVLAQLPKLVEGIHYFTNLSIFNDLIAPTGLITALFRSIIGPRLYNQEKQNKKLGEKDKE